MDYEKLIEQMKWWAEECDRTNFGCQAKKTLRDAATALSTLQAENEKLRAELEQVKRERDKSESFLGELEGAVYTGQYFHLRPMIEKWRGQED